MPRASTSPSRLPERKDRSRGHAGYLVGMNTVPVKAKFSVANSTRMPLPVRVRHEAAQIVEVTGEPVLRVHEHGVAAANECEQLVQLRAGDVRSVRTSTLRRSSSTREPKRCACPSGHGNTQGRRGHNYAVCGGNPSPDGRCASRL